MQGHTNITEIELSLDLLWRNNVPPSKVVLGIGFYRRSFELKDPQYGIPGCAFKGPATAGDCTSSAGTLAYFKIMDIIKKENPKIIHASSAAVNYMQYGPDKDQWVSYDNKVTLQQKVDWANKLGWVKSPQDSQACMYVYWKANLSIVWVVS